MLISTDNRLTLSSSILQQQGTVRTVMVLPLLAAGQLVRAKPTGILEAGGKFGGGVFSHKQKSVGA
jgi:hypothetical protein